MLVAIILEVLLFSLFGSSLDNGPGPKAGQESRVYQLFNLAGDIIAFITIIIVCFVSCCVLLGWFGRRKEWV